MMLIHFIIALCAFCILMFASIFFLATLFDKEERKICKNSFIVLIVSFLISYSYLFGCNKVKDEPWQSELIATEHIIALNDSQDINGRRYMRRGYISEELWYHYYVDIGDGFVANRVKSNSSTLHYTEDNFRVEWYKRYRNWMWFSEEEICHKIYIPKGSIVDDFTLDLE